VSGLRSLQLIEVGPYSEERKKENVRLIWSHGYRQVHTGEVVMAIWLIIVSEAVKTNQSQPTMENMEP